MASAANRNVLTLLAIVESNVLVIKKKYLSRDRNKTVLAMTTKHAKSVRNTAKLWKICFEQRDVDLIHTRLKIFLNRFMPVGVETDVVVITSMNLALLDWLKAEISNADRHKALDELEAEAFRLHKYFDRRLNKRLLAVSSG